MTLAQCLALWISIQIPIGCIVGRHFREQIIEFADEQFRQF